MWRGLVRCLLLGSVSVTVSCSGASGPLPPALGQPITAGDRFAWDQHATDAAELGTFRYAFYLDDVRTEAVGVSCSAGEMPDAFVCSSSLPDMPTGSHTIQMAAFVVNDGAVLESPRSSALRVFKQ